MSNIFNDLKQDVATYSSVEADEDDHDGESDCFKNVANDDDLD
jgi:hypothetical protein